MIRFRGARYLVVLQGAKTQYLVCRKNCPKKVKKSEKSTKNQLTLQEEYSIIAKLSREERGAPSSAGRSVRKNILKSCLKRLTNGIRYDMIGRLSREERAAAASIREIGPKQTKNFLKKFFKMLDKSILI